MSAATSADTPFGAAHADPPLHAARPALLERARPVLLALGGVLFALGNVMHPLEHTEAAEEAALWAASHLTFAAGALLVGVGLPLLARRMAGSRTGLTGCALAWFGFVMMPANAWLEVFVAPHTDHETMHAIESAIGVVGALVAVAFIGGNLLIGVGGWLTRALPRPAAAGVVLGSVVLVGGWGLPVKEGLWIIPATSAIGLGLAAGALRPGSRTGGSR